MRSSLMLGTIAVLAVGATAAWKIQRDHEREQQALLARAAISMEQAQAMALAAHPGARVTESEIEEEDGRLIWSFEIEGGGASGTVDVEVDAMTGEVLTSEGEEEDDDEEDGGRRGAGDERRETNGGRRAAGTAGDGGVGVS